MAGGGGGGAPGVLPVGDVRSVRVDPAVLFEACEAYVRRKDGARRVIGTLLGEVLGGVAVVRGAYVVPHSEETEMVLLDTDHHTAMLELSRKVNPKERVIGWFSVGDRGSAAKDSLLQGFYSQQCPRGVHLVVETAEGDLGADGGVRARGYVAEGVTIGGTKVADEFAEVPVDLQRKELERLGQGVLGQQLADELPSRREALSAAVRRLGGLVAGLQDGIETMRALGGMDAAAFGRHLLDTLPKGGAEQHAADETSDLLVLTYLTKLINVQVHLSEKLGTHSLPIM